MAKSSGLIHPDPFNEVDGKNPETADSEGKDLYFGGYDEILKNNLVSGPLIETPNSKASRDLYGGPTKGEPDPVKGGMGGKG